MTQLLLQHAKPTYPSSKLVSLLVLLLVPHGWCRHRDDRWFIGSFVRSVGWL